MATVQRNIELALIDLGALAAGETPPASELADALSVWNEIFSGWSQEGLTNPNIVHESFSLVDGDSTYTMGSGANFNTTRPVKITSARVESGSFSQGLQVMTMTEAVARANNPTGRKDVLPSILGVDFALTTVNLFVFPPPSGTPSIIIDSYKASFPTYALGDSPALNPGMEQAARRELAVKLLPSYPRASGVSAELLTALAQEAKAQITVPNAPPAQQGVAG